MNEWMDGWMDGWKDGWMGGLMNRQILDKLIGKLIQTVRRGRELEKTGIRNFVIDLIYSVQQFPHLTSVVQKVDSSIHWINHYPLSSAISFPNTYPLDSDLSGGQRYPTFEH